MKYPTLKVYEQLYGRFLIKSPAELFGGNVNLSGKSIIDLCGGTGIVSKYAFEQGAKVTYIDQSYDMMPLEWLRENHIPFWNLTIEQALLQRSYFCDDVPVDYVVCRQGINYWFCEEIVDEIYRQLKPGGMFIFNTFNTDPTIHPIVKTYRFDQHDFVEVSYRIGKTVHHVQITDGLEPHVTEFMWISPKEFADILATCGFQATENINDASSIWRCTK